MILTKNFKLKEFLESKFYDDKSQQKVLESYYKNKTELLPNIKKLAENLQVIRNTINKPIHINISYRPLWWEKKQGRSGNSKHIKGIAADIIVKGMTTKTLYKVIETLIQENKISEGGLGYYSNFIHYDIRGNKSRW